MNNALNRTELNEAYALVNEIEKTIVYNVKKGILKGAIKHPLSDRAQNLVDYIVRNVLNDYAMRGLYPLPYTCGSRVVFTIEFDIDTETYKKDYVLQSQPIDDKMTESMCDYQFKDWKLK